MHTRLCAAQCTDGWMCACMNAAHFECEEVRGGAHPVAQHHDGSQQLHLMRMHVGMRAALLNELLLYAEEYLSLIHI